MLCERIQQWLEDYHQGALPVDQVEQVAQHLRACPACADEERALSSYFNALGPVSRQVDVPVALRMGWRSAIAQELAQPSPQPQRAQRRWSKNGRRPWRIAVAAACIGLCIAGGVLLATLTGGGAPAAQQVAQASEVPRAGRSVPSLPVYDSVALSNRYTLTSNVQTLEVPVVDTNAVRAQIYTYAQLNNLEITECPRDTLWFTVQDEQSCVELENYLRDIYGVQCTYEVDGTLCMRLTGGA